MLKNVGKLAKDFLDGAVMQRSEILKRNTSQNKKAAEAAKKAYQQAKMANANISKTDARTIVKKAHEEAGGLKKYSKANAFGEFLGGGISGTYNNMEKNKMNFGDAFKAAHQKTVMKDGKAVLGANGKELTRLSKKKMLGTYMGVSTAGRLASGGGLMKDKNGNSNVIGIPFL